MGGEGGAPSSEVTKCVAGNVYIMSTSPHINKHMGNTELMKFIWVTVLFHFMLAELLLVILYMHSSSSLALFDLNGM